MLNDRSCATGDVLRVLLIYFDEFELHVRWIHRDVELKQKQELRLRLGRCQWHQLGKPHQDYYETFAQLQTILKWFQFVQRHRLTTQVVLRKAIKFASRRINIWRFNSFSSVNAKVSVGFHTFVTSRVLLVLSKNWFDCLQLLFFWILEIISGSLFVFTMEPFTSDVDLIGREWWIQTRPRDFVNWQTHVSIKSKTTNCLVLDGNSRIVFLLSLQAIWAHFLLWMAQISRKLLKNSFQLEIRRRRKNGNNIASESCSRFPRSDKCDR